jgi:sulfonate transport system permease protein
VTRFIRSLWFAGSIAVGALFVLLWQVVADHSGISAVFLPGPDRAWAAVVAGFADGDLLKLTWATVERMLYGWLLASLGGIAVGALIGSSRHAREFLGPSLEMIRPIPVTAFMPIAIAFLGLTGDMVLVVIGIGAIWPVLLATVHGIAAVEPRLVEVSRSLRLSRPQMLWKIALPNAQPDILAGMRLGLTVSLILAVIGEMLTSEDGLGHYVLVAARAFHSSEVFGGVILLGLIGFASNVGLQAAERRLLRWRRR